MNCAVLEAGGEREGKDQVERRTGDAAATVEAAAVAADAARTVALSPATAFRQRVQYFDQHLLYQLGTWYHIV